MSTSFYGGGGRPRNAGRVQDCSRRNGRTESRQYHHATTPRRSPTSTRLARGYQPGMRLQDFIDSDPPSSGDELANVNGGAGEPVMYPNSFTTPPNRHPTAPTYTGIDLGVPSRSEVDVTTLLQQHQGLLTRILQKQEQIELKQDEFQEKLTELETKIPSPSISSCSPGIDKGRRKRVVNKELSRKVSSIHEASEMKFNPEESSASQHNAQVKDSIMEQILAQPDNKYSKEIVNVSVKRCYQSIRRNFLEMQEGKEDFVHDQSKRRKYRSRRQRKFDRRSSVVTANEREKYWESLSYLYMTEESDDTNDSNTIVEHKLPWRSNKLDQYIEVLDKRLSEQVQKEYVGIVAKKVRKCGIPSSCKPPENVPAWAIKRNSEGCATPLGDISNN